MSKQIQLRRGTAAQHETFTGADGEVTVDTTNKTLRVHDGTTPGGVPLARADNKANISLNNLSTTGKSVITNLAMPTAKYTNISLQESGEIYTAPADGYFQLSIVAGVVSSYIIMENINNGLRADALGSQSYQTLSGTIPASKNQKVRVTYTASGNLMFFRFVYLNSD